MLGRAAAWLGAALLLATPLRLRAEPGVTDDEVVLGQPAAFSGPSAGLGVELWRGASAAFAEANARGGVHGRRIRLEIADDGYDANRAVPAVLDLLDRGVFALFGGVGTPTLVRVLPVLLRLHAAEDLFYFGDYSGSDPQRLPPYSDALFHLRASYRQETEAMVEGLLARGRERIGVFVQSDAFGTSGREGVRRALSARGRTIAQEVTFPRGQRFEEGTSAQVELLRRAGVDAIVAVGAYQASAALVRDVRAAGWQVPILLISFSGHTQLLALLRWEEARTGRVLTDNLFATEVVPAPDDLRFPLVRQYRAAMDRFAPAGPPPLGDGSYRPPSRYGYTSLEGYLYGRAFLAILEQTGRPLTRQRFHRIAEAIGPFDLGLGTPLRFTHDDHQAIDRLWFAQTTARGWIPVPSLAAVLPAKEGACAHRAC